MWITANVKRFESWRFDCLVESNRFPENFPGPVAFFQDFWVLENARIEFQDFPGFPGAVQTLNNRMAHSQVL